MRGPRARCCTLVLTSEYFSASHLSSTIVSVRTTQRGRPIQCGRCVRDLRIFATLRYVLLIFASRIEWRDGSAGMGRLIGASNTVRRIRWRSGRNNAPGSALRVQRGNLRGILGTPRRAIVPVLSLDLNGLEKCNITCDSPLLLGWRRRAIWGTCASRMQQNRNTVPQRSVPR